MGIKIIRTPPPEPERNDALQAKFDKFNVDNPHVLVMIEDKIREARAAGVRRIGMVLIINQIRWQTMITTTDKDFKINENYSSRYVRLICQRHPEWESMFEQRRLRAK
jgi:hypothetical protein